MKTIKHLSKNEINLIHGGGGAKIGYVLGLLVPLVITAPIINNKKNRTIEVAAKLSIIHTSSTIIGATIGGVCHLMSSLFTKNS